MFPSWTTSLGRKSRADTSSPVRSTRTITFPDHMNEPASSYRAKFLYRDNSQQRAFPYIDDDGSEENASEEDREEEEDNDSEGEDTHEDAISSSSDGDDVDEGTSLLPLFSSAHLTTLPVFTLTHTFREMVLERCDTVLTWEQLRSPQVSSFLVKPIHFDIKENYMSAAAIWTLMANCLQFTKEANLHPANSGTNRTRALICELIAIKLLREYTTRELIDALSYDFDPLQGQSQSGGISGVQQIKRQFHRSARISCLEIAIRASSKRFLAHPLIVQHLEAIWNGLIVFHSAADSMHRKKPSQPTNSYGTTSQSTSGVPPDFLLNKKEVSLYNPRDASLFKLSRLRVPRYRNVLSTVSFAVLLALFLSVLKARSLEITSLEIVFWAWAAGYMLDEVIGFNEQGFSLYLASFWNTFDVGILMLLGVHLCLRLYGVIVPLDQKAFVYVAHRSYDVLAISAILVFPRLFSVLDHYKYFSTLIIAFRMMASDMLAIFFLIVIFCSGFLVALTFAFGYDTVDDPQAVAYALLQMLLGYTPAAWDRWANYNWMGRFVLTLFLFVCHFVVVTILITVLTNSFMEIVRNAHEEHQYLFAVNTISNVKSDALFAYIPPLNVLQWLLTPLRYFLPFREYVKVNRTIIKATHFPILFLIYSYERLVLRPRYIDTVDLVESRSSVRRTLSERIPRMMRKPSMATVRQEAALEEVFRRRANTTLRTDRSQERQKNSNVVSHWMQNVDQDAEPQEQDRKLVDKLEQRRRHGPKRFANFDNRDVSMSRRPTSIASDPYDFTSHVEFLSPRGHPALMVDRTPSAIDVPSQKTKPKDNADLQAKEKFPDQKISGIDQVLHHNDYFASKDPSITVKSKHTESTVQELQYSDYDFVDLNDPLTQPMGARPKHNRNISSATMIWRPAVDSEKEVLQPTEPGADCAHLSAPISEPEVAPSKPSSNLSSQKPPKKLLKEKLRPILPAKMQQAFRSVPNFENLLSQSGPTERSEALPEKERRRSLEMDLVSDIGDNKAIGGGYVGAIPASFASRMAFTTNPLRYSREDQQRQTEKSEMFGRLMMARMNTLEESFREVVHEVRESMRQTNSGFASRQRSPERQEAFLSPKKPRRGRERLERLRGSVGSGTTMSVASDEKEMDLPVTGGSATGRDTLQRSGEPAQLPEVLEMMKEDSIADTTQLNKQDSTR